MFGRILFVIASRSRDVPLSADGMSGIRFDNIGDCLTGSRKSVTDYILEAPAKCPNCRREILEKTL